MNKAILSYLACALVVVAFGAGGCKKKPSSPALTAKGGTAAATPTAQPTPRTAVVVEGPLNLRDAPGTGGKIIGRLSQGEKVAILEEGASRETIDNKTAPWYKVETIDKKQGWVFGGYLDVGAKTPAGTAVSTAPATGGGDGAPLAAINVAAASESGWTPAQYYQAGKEMLNAKRFADALPYLKTATETSPQTGNYWVDLGVALQELGRHDEAATAYERAVVLMPTSFWAYNNLGLACVKSRRPRRAVEALEKALTLEPKGTADPAAAKAIARRNLAAAYEMNGQPDKARELK